MDQYIFDKWTLGNTMIPYLPKDTSDLDICPFYKQIVDNLIVRSMHHEAWHTHKRDTSVCWICDLLEISKLLINEMERVISKSALDIDDQFHDSEVVSEEGESEDSLNYDEEVIDGSNESNPSGIQG